ncbi:DEAD/DEAH box helicase [Planotetraspora kaengkrachanensis]
MALPLALAGQDVIGQARTGTGKTYAFGVAMLQLVGKPRKNRKKPRGLVIVPTRELALQVTEDLVLAGGKLGSRILTVYGGRAYEPQIESLKNGVDVVVGTPGRLLDLVKQKHLDLGQITMLVLDEADRMLDLGFLPDMERIIKLVPEQRQTMLFSATMPGEIVTLSRRYLTRPTHVRAENSAAEDEALPKTTQFVYRTHRMDKIEILARLLQSTGNGLTMVFCETKRACDMVSEQLQDKGFAAAAVHGDLGQGQREQALRAFRNGKINVLVATDVAARGIDIDDVTHVVNYDCPQDEKAYVHRIGRTGRAGRTGVAVTFVEWTELTRWKVINNALDLDFADPVETYSSSPHLYSDLDIPEGTKGVLPRANRSRAGLAAEEIEDLGETGRVRTRKQGRDREQGRDRDRDDDERRKRPTRTRERRRTRGGRAQAEADGVDAAETAVGAEPVSAPAPRTETVPTLESATTTETATTAETVGAFETATSVEQAGLVEQASPVKPVKSTRRATSARRAAAAEATAPVEAAVEAPVEAAVEPLPAVTTEPARRALHADVTEEAPPMLPPAQRSAPQPERIVPASPFVVVFQSPDLATEDDDPAPSAATERAHSRRRPSRPRPRRTT